MAEHATPDVDSIGADDPAELDALAGRLEAALDKIVRHLEAPSAPPRPVSPEASVATTDMAARLDGLIARLRDALGGPAGSNPGRD